MICTHATMRAVTVFPPEQDTLAVISMSRAPILLALLFFAATLTTAQTPNQPITAVAHIDFMPDHLDVVPGLIAYVAQASHDANILHVELFQQISATNHYTLVETFRNRAAYNAHVAAPYTLKFRSIISPALGAPYDERLQTQVAIH
jgi:quinol monooxygenase YgiN